MKKQNTKRVKNFVESKIKSDPGKYYFFAMLFVLLGILGALFNQHQIAESRLLHPTIVNVKFLGASCQGQSGSGNRVTGPHMFKTYEYSPSQTDGPAKVYAAYDSVPYASRSDCEADLKHAHNISSRAQAWYDRDAPWRSRWSLEEPSPVRVFWYFLAPAGLIFLFGLLAHGKANKQPRR